ncbi:MAG: membrane protein insertase YidC [Mycobacteriaceae bacterium]|nr:membrane protein insertase YidC [Mycobacteriaceae bacterium]
MLDFIYYPISAVLWFWHRVFGFVLGPDNGFAWALSVVFLVFTLRLLLYKPFVKQVRTTRQMQELQPQIKELQRKYKNDRQQQALEMQKLQREHGFNPLMGCLPVLAQAPVFIGLYHVLNSFNRTGHGFGKLGLTPDENAQIGNYVFSVGDVQSFLRARLFGAPISSYITAPHSYYEGFTKFGGVPTWITVAVVAVPLMVLASVATHFNARASVARQSPEALANPQAAMMNKLALWVFPLGVLVGGPFLPISVLLYWVANNIWTYGQQHLVFAKIEHEDAEKKRAAVERKSANAPKPGAKPVKKKDGGASAEAGPDVSVSDGAVLDGAAVDTNGSGEPTASGQKVKQTQRRQSGQKRSGSRGRANQKKRR